ncbi:MULTISPECIES: hypothetical protein [Pectobacterium]|nr:MULTISPECIES: hypothetical protein [Pectobacterium]
MSDGSCQAAVAAIQFALELDADECKMFLRYWNEGDFRKCIALN